MTVSCKNIFNTENAPSKTALFFPFEASFLQFYICSNKMNEGLTFTQPFEPTTTSSQSMLTSNHAALGLVDDMQDTLHWMLDRYTADPQAPLENLQL